MALAAEGVGGAGRSLWVGAAMAVLELLCPVSPMPYILEAADCAAPTLAQPGRTHCQARSLCHSGPWPHVATVTCQHCREGMGRQ